MDVFTLQYVLSAVVMLLGASWISWAALQLSAWFDELEHNPVEDIKRIKETCEGLLKCG